MTTDKKRLEVVELALTPNPGLIEVLESLLADAKAGRLTDYAIVAYSVPGSVVSSFVAKHEVMSLLGEIRCLERDILDCCVDKRLHRAGDEY